jgi:hypothetical protein
MGWHAVYRIVAAIAVLGIASSLLAHRVPGSLTTIKWNAVSERTEIIHRLHTHDAELAVGASLDIPDLSVEDVAGRAHIALYVEEHFHIKSSGDEFQLDLVGAELSGNYILVYQESPERLAQNILIRDDILMDAFPAQTNQVNIEDRDAVHSLVFTQDDGWLSYKFLQK